MWTAPGVPTVGEERQCVLLREASAFEVLILLNKGQEMGHLQRAACHHPFAHPRATFYPSLSCSMRPEAAPLGT